MGIAVPGICGGYLAGQNLAGTWRTILDTTPELVLNADPFVHEVYEGPVIKLSINRPVLHLRAKSLVFAKDTVAAPGRARLILKAGVFEIGPFALVEFNKPRLYLRGKLALLSTSSSPSFGRPTLILLGREFRAGKPGLSASIPESRPLVPSAAESGTLVPSASSSKTLAASATGTRPLQPTVPGDGDDLLVPTDVEIR